MFFDKFLIAHVTKVTQLSLNILTIKSFDRGNINEKKRKVFTENFAPQTPEN
jgi:hypothetical protein